MLFPLALLVVGCATPAPRTITGKLVSPASQAPIVGQQLDLDRPPGNYPGLSMLILGIPQPTAIARTTTDANGRFRFVVTKDRDRFLTIRLAGSVPSDFRSNVGYRIIDLEDSLAPESGTRFDSRLIHERGGGFRAVR